MDQEAQMQVYELRDIEEVVIAKSDLEVTMRLYENRISDLKNILDSRDSIHLWNTILMYSFHFTQTTGIFIVSVCTSMSLTKYIWIGVALNALASVFDAIRQANTKISSRKMKDLEKIKSGNYIDEDDVDLAPYRSKLKHSGKPAMSRTRTMPYEMSLPHFPDNSSVVDTKPVVHYPNIDYDAQQDIKNQIYYPSGDIQEV